MNGQSQSLSRRHVLAGAGIGALAGLGVCGIPYVAGKAGDGESAGSAETSASDSAAAASSPTKTPYDKSFLTGEVGDAKLQLYTLGTGAGQTFNPGRTGTCSVLVVDGSHYLIDAGWSAARRFQQANLKPLDIKAGFITHQHSDHIADLFNIFWGALHTGKPEQPIAIYGPGPSALPKEPAQPLPVTKAGGDPRPGMAETLKRLAAAYTAENNTVAAEFKTASDYADSLVGKDIQLPSGVVATPEDNAPAMQPFEVYSDDKVKVLAILVPHGQAFPSYAYRFETQFGTVVFSGDTAKHENIVTLAKGADLLVHEAIDVDYYAAHGSDEAAITHFKETHTTPQDVGLQATAAGVRSVLLSHLGPGSSEDVPDESWASRVKESFTGTVVVGHDLERWPIEQGKGVPARA